MDETSVNKAKRSLFAIFSLANCSIFFTPSSVLPDAGTTIGRVGFEDILGLGASGDFKIT